MRAFIIAFAFFFGLLTQAYANSNNLTIDKTKISASDLQKVEDIINKGNGIISTTQTITDNLTDPAKLNEWANLGTNVGRALSSAAKELGTGVAEFAKTPIGTMVTFIVLWKIFASDIMLLFLGLFTLIIVNTVLYRYFRQRSFHIKAEGPWYKRTSYERTTLNFKEAWTSEDGNWPEFFVLLAIFILNNIIAVASIIHIG